MEAKAEYDSAFSIAAVPVTLDRGLGDNFWLMAGTTLGPNPSLGLLPLQYSGFFNTYGLGLQLLNIDLNFAHLVLISEVTYTSTAVANPADQLTSAFGNLAALLLGLKGYVGAGLDFKL